MALPAFDPDAGTSQPLDIDNLDSAVSEAMTEAGVDSAFIYAYRRTGLIVTTENEHRLAQEDREAWMAALAEYLGAWQK